MTRVMLVLWLAFAWVLLWGTPSIANIVSGLALGALLVRLVPQGSDRGSGVHPIAVLRFGLHFAWALVVATVEVARSILQPRLQLEQGVVAVPLRAMSPVVVAFIANSVSLTPGTLSLDVRPRDYGVDDAATETEGSPDADPVLFVHCLVTGDPEQIRANVRKFEELAVAAFGSPQDRSAITAPPPPWPRPVDGPGGPRRSGPATGTAHDTARNEEDDR